MLNKVPKFQKINSNINELIKNKFITENNMNTFSNLDKLSNIKINVEGDNCRYFLFNLYNLKIKKYNFFDNLNLKIDDLISWKNNFNNIIISYSKKNNLYLFHYYNNKNLLNIYYFFSKKFIAKIFFVISFEYEIDNENIKIEFPYIDLFNEQIYKYEWAFYLSKNFSNIKKLILNLENY